MVSENCTGCVRLKAETHELKFKIRSLQSKISRINKITEALTEATKLPVMQTTGIGYLMSLSSSSVMI